VKNLSDNLHNNVVQM